MKTLLLAAVLAFNPPPGKLLVEAPSYGMAIVQPGHVTHLGKWYFASWSPDGTLIAAANGRRLAVLDERGGVRWTLRRSLPVQPTWSPDGTLIAYGDGAAVRVVGADGRGDRTLASAVRFTSLAWRPGTHELAWQDRRGAIVVRDAATGRRLWRSRPGNRVRRLLWSPRGGRLAAISGSYVRRFGPRGAPLRRIPAGRRGHFQTGTYLGRDLVLVRHRFSDGATYVTRGDRTLIADRGSVVDITPSPDGRRLVLGRRSRDQWQLWPPAPPIRRVTRAVNPQAPGVWAFPRIRGWR